MKVIKGLKKVGAVAGSGLLTAVTLAAAVNASDLSDYPEPFVNSNGVFDGKLVIGAAAATSDVVGAIDISASLQAAAGTPASGIGTVTVSNGKVEELTIGQGLNAATAFGSALDDTDLPGVLKDSSVTISVDGESETYDYHEEIVFTSGISVETGLTYTENDGDEWEDKVFIPAAAASMKYCIVFDETLEDDTYITNTTSDDPMFLSFLGRELEIQGTDGSATKLKVKAGQEFNLNAGESVVVNGHTITLIKTGGTAANVEVDGQVETLTAGSARTISGLRIEVDNIFDDDGIQWDSATIIAGEETFKTYQDGDEFLGEPDSEYMWEWELAGLTGGTPTLCILQAEDAGIDDPEDESVDGIEHPLYLGESYSFPFGYAQVTFANLLVDDYQTYKVDVTSKSLYGSANGGVGISNAKVLRIQTISGDDDQGFIIGSEKSEEVYLYFYDNETTGLGVYRRDRDGTKAIAVQNVTEGETLFVMDYKQSAVNVTLDGLTGTGTSGNFNMTMRSGAPDSDYINMYVETSAANQITWLGHSNGDTTVAWDLSWSTDDGSWSDISSWEENTRTSTGIIIEDPDSNSNNDEHVFMIPSDVDEFEVSVVVSGAGSTTTSTGSGGAVTVNPIAVGLAILDTDASGLLGSENLLVVGGPCVNTIAANLMGNPTDCAEGFSDGFGMIKWFDAKRAMLVAGYSAADTTAAARVLSDYDLYSAQLVGAEVQVVTSSKTVQRVTS